MKNILKKITQTELDKVKEALQANPICRPMNDLKDTNKDNGEIRIWLNPHNQKCFNSGWFTYQDFYDWSNNTGKIVKGDTDEEKQKFIEVAVFEQTHDYGWSIFYNKGFFHLIDETFHIELKPGYGMYRTAKNSLKITKTNHAEIIGKVMGSICRYYMDLEITYNSNAQRKMHDELVGAKETLFMLGVGYYGANNLPEDPENLQWIADICMYKAVYLYYYKKYNGKLPDFDFVLKYKSKN